jgi:hypothetical protein
MRQEVVSSIRPSFPGLSQSQGQVTHVLLTRSPLIHPASWASSFDLHVLSTPPAFVLSQDQTLRQKNNENIKPRLKMLPPPHGGEATTTNQPNKTSGINKHGTLLSSQTTDQQPGTTPGNRVGNFRCPPRRNFVPRLRQLDHPTQSVLGVSTCAVPGSDRLEGRSRMN